MILLLLILSVVILVPSMYKRYVPVKNVPCKKNNINDHSSFVLDIRAYNEKRSDINRDIMNIPYAYLKRFNKEIPQDNIHVIASDRLELNLGIRLLRGKGIKVTSYELSDCLCSK